jgi:hypothetical protein
MQVGAKEAVEPQRLLLHPLFEATQKIENSTAEIRVSSIRDGRKKQKKQKAASTHKGRRGFHHC